MLGTHTASVTESEVREERHPTGAQDNSRMGQTGRDLLEGLGDSSCWSGQTVYRHSKFILQASAQEHTDPDLSLPSGRIVDKITAMDSSWEQDSLFNTGWYFQRRDEMKAVVCGWAHKFKCCWLNLCPLFICIKELPLHLKNTNSLPCSAYSRHFCVNPLQRTNMILVANLLVILWRECWTVFLKADLDFLAEFVVSTYHFIFLLLLLNVATWQQTEANINAKSYATLMKKA